MTINELKNRKEELGYSWEMIAELSGVSLKAVKELFLDNTATSITYEERTLIEQVLKETGSNEIEETWVPYLTKKQGEYTLEDYAAISEDVRVELIDGVLLILNIYGFDSRVPVGIFNGECVVDFARISDEISFWDK